MDIEFKKLEFPTTKPEFIIKIYLPKEGDTSRCIEIINIQSNTKQTYFISCNSDEFKPATTLSKDLNISALQADDLKTTVEVELNPASKILSYF